MNHERLETFDWPTDAQSYQLLGKIGRGAFATVYKAIPKTAPPPEEQAEESTQETAQPQSADATTTTTTQQQQLILNPAYACGVKILNLDHVDSDLQEIRREVQALRLSSHPNILTCYRAFVHDIHLWLITTLMRKGSAVHCLQTARRRYSQQQQQQLEQQSSTSENVRMEPHIFYILQQSLLGLQYIHETQHAIHRDCKGGNILIDSDGSVRIADFGVSQWLMNFSSRGPQEKARTFVGTPCWMAPEVMEQHSEGYDQKADIWSMGITALELAKGYAPYAKYPPMKVLILTIQEDPPSLDTYLTLDDDEDDADMVAVETSDDANNNNPQQQAARKSSRRAPVVVTEDYSKQFIDFVDKCLQKNPSRRPTCADLLQHHPGLRQMSSDAAYLNQRRLEMQRQVCDVVSDVGNLTGKDGAGQHAQQAQAAQQALNDPVQQQRLHHQQQVKIMFEESSKNQEHVKGTTWVFSDGSQVLSSTALSADEMSVDDVLDQVEQIGQSHQQNDATLPASGKSALLEQGGQSQQPATDVDDDVDQFLSDLEQTLPGEDFQRPTESSG